MPRRAARRRAAAARPVGASRIRRRSAALAGCLWLATEALTVHADTDPATPAASTTERFVYFDDQLAGIFKICIPADDPRIFLEESFFEQLKLPRGERVIQCAGKDYFESPVKFIRNDAAGTLNGSRPTSPARPPDAPGDSQPSALAHEAPPDTTHLVSASVLEHTLGVWATSSGSVDLSLGLTAEQFTHAGLFTLVGNVARQNAQTEWSSSQLDWKRHWAAYAMDTEFGVTTLGAAGLSKRLYGLNLGSDQETTQALGTHSLTGVADVPGKLVIRSQGAVLREVPVDPGYFSIPIDGNLVDDGRGAFYNLTLEDTAGNTARTWDVFLPSGAQLLSQGATLWDGYVGKGLPALASRPGAAMPAVYGTGGVWRHGVSDTNTFEAIGDLSRDGVDLGLLDSIAPTAWFDASFGAAAAHGARSLATQWFSSLEMQGEHMGLSAFWTRATCARAASQSAGTLPGVSECTSWRVSSYGGSEVLGRIGVTLSQTNAAGTGSIARNFSWVLPTMHGIDTTLYAAALKGASGTSRSIGLSLTLPLASGRLAQTVTHHAGQSSLASSFSASATPTTQYEIHAEDSVIPHSGAPTGNIGGTLTLDPWYGTEQGYAQVAQTGAMSVGATESSALVRSDGEWMVAAPGNQGYAVVRLPGLPDVSIEDGTGTSRAVTNRDGFAAVAAIHAEVADLQVAADQLPRDLSVTAPLVGDTRERWTSTLWQPLVRRVNKGWLRLVREDGSPLPLGATFRLARGTDDFYVLGNGEAYVDDLPLERGRVVVHFPGDVARCTFEFSDNVLLDERNLPTKPQFACRLAAS